MKIEFQTSIVRLSFLCRIMDIKSTWINPWFKDVIHLENEYLMASMLLVLASTAHFKKLIEPAKQACLVTIMEILGGLLLQYFTIFLAAK